MSNVLAMCSTVVKQQNQNNLMAFSTEFLWTRETFFTRLQPWMGLQPTREHSQLTSKVREAGMPMKSGWKAGCPSKNLKQFLPLPFYDGGGGVEVRSSLLTSSAQAYSLPSRSPPSLS